MSQQRGVLASKAAEVAGRASGGSRLGGVGLDEFTHGNGRKGGSSEGVFISRETQGHREAIVAALLGAAWAGSASGGQRRQHGRSPGGARSGPSLGSASMPALEKVYMDGYDPMLDPAVRQSLDRVIRASRPSTSYGRQSVAGGASKSSSQ